MTDLSTSYLGLKLENPIIIGSSGLTNSVEKIINLEKNRAGAVVLKSVFEEQINLEINKAVASDQSGYPEAADYIKNYTKQESIGQYLSLIEDAKKAVNIPVIASVNCVSANEWTSFAKRIESAGADALELNAFILPSNENMDASQNEQIYFDIIEKVRSEVSIPIALKMSYFSSGLANLVQKLCWSGNINGLVLFNRFYSPDIDVDKLLVGASNIFSSPEEVSIPLRWTALLSPKVKCDIAASTGIHDGKSVIKMLLAGATAVQIASIIYNKGPEYITYMLTELEAWMGKNKYKDIESFRGKMNQEKISNPAALERIQFMKYYSGIE